MWATGWREGLATRPESLSLRVRPAARRCYPSQIEGTQSSLSDLLLFELDEAPGVPFDDVVEVSNYVAALEHGMARLRGGFPISNRLLREVHDKLLRSGRGADKQPGEFRRSQNWLGGTRPGNARFVPPPPQRVEACMASLERAIHARDDGLPVLVKAALAHVQFETIHLFLDGNGRVGRLLISLMLHDDGVLEQPLLYLSYYFKQHRDEYYRLPRPREDRRRLGGVAGLLPRRRRAHGRRCRPERTPSARAVQSPTQRGCSRSDAPPRAPCESTTLCATDRYPPSRRSLSRREQATPPYPVRSKNWKGLGIVREITGRKRGRVFAYTRYLDILGEGTEPL